MKQKRPKISHQYDVDFLFENDSIKKWQEILQWEASHGFTGSRSRLWSQSDHDVYFYYLITNEQYDFIDSIPLTENFHQGMKITSQQENLLHIIAQHAKEENAIRPLIRFIEHLFIHDSDRFIAQNEKALNPLSLAIQHENKNFIIELKRLMCDSTQINHLKPQFIQSLYADIYDTHRVTAPPEIRRLLYDMGTVLLSDQDNKKTLDDFKLNHPQCDSEHAPFSSVRAFQAALSQAESSSSRSFTGMLPGAASYWKLVLEAAMLAHHETPFSCHHYQALYDSLDNKPSSDEIPDEYYEALDTLIFILRAEELFAQEKEQENRNRGLNPIRLGIDSVLHTHFGILAVFLIFGLYIYFLTLISGNSDHHFKEYKYLRDEIREECNPQFMCNYFYSPNYWSCCKGENISQWCEDEWPKIYRQCCHELTTSENINFGLLMYFIGGLLFNFLGVSLAGIILESLLKGLGKLLGPYQFKANNQSSVHQTLQALMAILTERCPTLTVDQPGLSVINTACETLTHDEFVQAITSMNLALGRYHSQAQFLPNVLRLSSETLQSHTQALPLFKAMPRKTVQRPVLHAFDLHEDIDIESGIEETRPLLGETIEKIRTCIIL